MLIIYTFNALYCLICILMFKCYLPFISGVLLRSILSFETGSICPEGVLEVMFPNPESGNSEVWSCFISRSGVKGEISPRKPGPIAIVSY